MRGIVKAGACGLGVVSLRRDLGVSVSLSFYTDSTAGKSIGLRRGVGKVRHLDTRELWIQERVARGDLVLRKVSGAENIADILTKHVTRSVLDQHLRKIGVVRREGRNTLCPSV